MKLSIITINYNDSKGLEKTLDSIILHKTDDIELIVIDGGSSDTSLDVILHHKENIDYYISEKDKGIYNAMNKGIERANGSYLLFVNSGDSLLPSTNFKLILDNTNDMDIVYYNLEIIDKEHKYIKYYPNKLDFKHFIEDALPHPATLIKRELFIDNGSYREDLKIISDWAFFMECILLHGCTYTHVDNHFSSFVLGGISSQPQSLALVQKEKDRYIEEKFSDYVSLYQEWKENKTELYKLKTSISVRFLKRIGFLKWLNL